MGAESLSDIDNITNIRSGVKALGNFIKSRHDSYFPPDASNSEVQSSLEENNFERVYQALDIPKQAIIACGSILSRSESPIVSELGLEIYNSLNSEPIQLNVLTYFFSEDVEHLVADDFSFPILEKFKLGWRDRIVAGTKNQSIALLIPFSAIGQIAQSRGLKRDSEVNDLLLDVIRASAEMKLLELKPDILDEVPVKQLITDLQTWVGFEAVGGIDDSLRGTIDLDQYKGYLGIYDHGNQTHIS